MVANAKKQDGLPINLLKSRQTKITVGGQEMYVWCDTHQGRLRLRVVLPDGAEIEHIRLTPEVSDNSAITPVG